MIDIQVKQTVTTDEQTEVFEFNTTGECLKKRHTYIIYEEVLEDIKTQVRVKVEDGQVRIHRKGALSLDFLFVPYETTQNMYHMANQKTVMDITTNQLHIEHNDQGGHIYIQYHINNNGANLGSYSYEITYKERME